MNSYKFEINISETEETLKLRAGLKDALIQWANLSTDKVVDDLIKHMISQETKIKRDEEIMLNIHLVIKANDLLDLLDEE
jgi:RNA processing factor Prp31